MGQLGEGVLGWRRTAADSLFIVITSYINIVISYSKILVSISSYPVE